MKKEGKETGICGWIYILFYKVNMNNVIILAGSTTHC